jgi:hypothetical protein
MGAGEERLFGMTSCLLGTRLHGRLTAGKNLSIRVEPVREYLGGRCLQRLFLDAARKASSKSIACHISLTFPYGPAVMPPLTASPLDVGVTRFPAMTQRLDKSATDRARLRARTAASQASYCALETFTTPCSAPPALAKSGAGKSGDPFPCGPPRDCAREFERVCASALEAVFTSYSNSMCLP